MVGRRSPACAASGSVELTGTWPDAYAFVTSSPTPFAATTTGTLVPAGPFRVDVVNEWQNLAWPSVAGVASPSGRLTLAGSLDEYRYDGTGTVDDRGPRRELHRRQARAGDLLLELAQLELDAGSARRRHAARAPAA